MIDWKGEHRYAKYSHFYVAPESDNYRLNVSGYTGNAGSDEFGRVQNGQQFSTIDKSGGSPCPFYYDGSGGFWWDICDRFTPNTQYSRTSSVPPRRGLLWRDWHGMTYSLKAVSMAFRAIN